jgi:hypothetical protein
VVAVLLAGGLAACGSEDAEVVLRTDGKGVSSLAGDDPAAATAAASALAYESADVAVLGAESDSWAVSQKTAEVGAPGLLTGAGGAPAADAPAGDEGASGDAEADDAVSEELDRLGVETVFVPAGSETPAAAGDRAVVTFNPETLEAEEGDAPEVSRQGDAANASLFLDRGSDRTPAQEVAGATVEAADGTVTQLPEGDPRATAETVEAAKASESAGVLAMGESFADRFESRLETARTAPELPGGGQSLFPGRRMVAAYGSPGIPSLGILGEQDLDATVDRVQELAAEYEDVSAEPVVPAMEIITTVASGQAGADGNYSAELDPETLKPWIERAAEEGIYVVLDLQPGTSSFPEQAKLYEDLLREPHVGLALDSEWRLEGGQRHLEQIGSVDAAEVNETAQWLADLTAEAGLPQKAFVLHQFSASMITDREDIDASRDELAMLLHADGHGTPDLKLETWNALQRDLPAGVRMAWKNFYDEDTPMFTPEQTLELDPAPWFVSYQ